MKKREQAHFQYFCKKIKTNPLPVTDTSVLKEITQPVPADSGQNSSVIHLYDSLRQAGADSISENSFTNGRLIYRSEKGWGNKPITSLDYKPFIPDWILGVFFMTILLITWIRYWNSNILGLIVKAVYTRRDFQFLLRESTNIPDSVPFSINLIYTSGLALMAFVFTQEFFRQEFYPEIHNLIFFSICFLAVIALFYLKLMVTKAIGSLLKIPQISLEYHYNNLIYRLIASFGLLIFLILNFFLPEFHFMVAAVIWAAVIYLARSVKGVLIIAGKQNTSVYYIILYFCTLEILPVVVVAKAVNIFIN